MNSEEELLRLQKILAATVVMVALSVGVGGFSDFAAWHEIEYNEYCLTKHYEKEN